LMKVLSGAEQPDAGSMALDGQPYAPHNPHDARRRGVAMVYQELTLAPHLSVEANMLLGIEPARWGFLRRWEGRRRVEQALAELFPRVPHPIGEPLLEMRDLLPHDSPAMQGVSLSLHRGEVLGLAGVVGAGRTELLRGMFGLDPVRRGEVRILTLRGPTQGR